MSTNRVFIDSEFIEDGLTISPVSLAFVKEGGESLYIVIQGCDYSKANAWVRANVLPNLMRSQSLMLLTVEEARDVIVSFVGRDPEFWGYYCDYDWVMLCQVFGDMGALPASWPEFCLDLKQRLYEMSVLYPGCHGIRSVEGSVAHNALSDAEAIRDVFLETELIYDGLLGRK